MKFCGVGWIKISELDVFAGLGEKVIVLHLRPPRGRAAGSDYRIGQSFQSAE
jgi:hypothetical protein